MVNIVKIARKEFKLNIIQSRFFQHTDVYCGHMVLHTVENREEAKMKSFDHLKREKDVEHACDRISNAVWTKTRCESQSCDLVCVSIEPLPAVLLANNALLSSSGLTRIQFFSS